MSTILLHCENARRLFHVVPPFCREQRQLLQKCAATALSSKLVARQKEFFAHIVVDAVSHLDEMLPLNMIGMKKVTGGGLEVGAYMFAFC